MKKSYLLILVCVFSFFISSCSKTINNPKEVKIENIKAIFFNKPGEYSLIFKTDKDDGELIQETFYNVKLYEGVENSYLTFTERETIFHFLFFQNSFQYTDDVKLYIRSFDEISGGEYTYGGKFKKTVKVTKIQ